MVYKTIGNTVICYVTDSPICYVVMFYDDTVESFAEDFNNYGGTL